MKKRNRFLGLSCADLVEVLEQIKHNPHYAEATLESIKRGMEEVAKTRETIQAIAVATNKKSLAGLQAAIDVWKTKETTK